MAGFKECYGKGYRLFNPCESEKPNINSIVKNYLGPACQPNICPIPI